MRQSAIIWAGISRVVFATSIDYLKKHGWNHIDISAADVNKAAAFYKGTITGGILADKTDILFTICDLFIDDNSEYLEAMKNILVKFNDTDRKNFIKQVESAGQALDDDMLAELGLKVSRRKLRK